MRDEMDYRCGKLRTADTKAWLEEHRTHGEPSREDAGHPSETMIRFCCPCGAKHVTTETERTMIDWHEPPKARVGRIPWEERDEYEPMNAAGERCREGEEIALLIRKKDRKVLRPATWIPVSAWNAMVRDPIAYGRPNRTAGFWVEEV